MNYITNTSQHLDQIATNTPQHPSPDDYNEIQHHQHKFNKEFLITVGKLLANIAIKQTELIINSKILYLVHLLIISASWDDYLSWENRCQLRRYNSYPNMSKI